VVELSDGVIILRPLTQADAEEHLAGDDEENIRWLSGGVSTIDHVVAFIRRSEEEWRTNSPRRNFGIWDAATGKLAGNVEANAGDAGLTGVGPGEANISYSVFPQWRGRGYATRAVDLLCRHLGGLGIDRAVIRVHPENVRSIAVAQRAGVLQTGVIDNDDGIPLIRYERATSPAPI